VVLKNIMNAAREDRPHFCDRVRHLRPGTPKTFCANAEGRLDLPRGMKWKVTAHPKLSAAQWQAAAVGVGGMGLKTRARHPPPDATGGRKS